MPIFNNEILFIHIPKSGGTSIQNLLIDKGLKCELYSPNLSTLINNHTPQHCTFLELEKLGVVDDKIKIFTVIRNPVDRVISEYFYNLEYRKHLLPQLGETFDQFLDLFLDTKNYKFFDYHNLCNYDFIINKNNEVDKRIKIFNYFDTKGIEEYLGFEGLDNYRCYKTNKENFVLNKSQEERILNFYHEDMAKLFHSDF
jgi:hypothetical protein